jgi:hypothetical protein
VALVGGGHVPVTAARLSLLDLAEIITYSETIQTTNKQTPKGIKRTWELQLKITFIFIISLSKTHNMRSHPPQEYFIIEKDRAVVA